MKKYILLAFIFSFQISLAQKCLDVDFKLRGYFYAGTSVVDTTALGGFYEDKNVPKKITGEIAEFSVPDEFQLIVKTDLTSADENGISNFKVFVVNQSDSLVRLPAQDSRLKLKRQVFHDKTWKDIEYLPSSWCGNSYHDVYIKPDEFWEFTAPCLTGKIEAKFRFELYVNENLSVYSNEFSGSFNKKQLKKEQGYVPQGFMDPYNN